MFVPWSRAGRGSGASVLLATGAASMGLDLLVLMNYQARVGMLHAGLGILLGAFLGGTAWGASLGGRLLAGRTERDLLQRACIIQARPGRRGGLLLPRLPILSPILSTLPYGIVALLLGMTCGFPFPIVARATTAGSAWAIDALGGILGALLFLTAISWGSAPAGLALAALPLIALIRIRVARS